MPRLLPVSCAPHAGVLFSHVLSKARARGSPYRDRLRRQKVASSAASRSDSVDMGRLDRDRHPRVVDPSPSRGSRLSRGARRGTRRRTCHRGRVVRLASYKQRPDFRTCAIVDTSAGELRLGVGLSLQPGRARDHRAPTDARQWRSPLTVARESTSTVRPPETDSHPLSGKGQVGPLSLNTTPPTFVHTNRRALGPPFGSASCRLNFPTRVRETDHHEGPRMETGTPTGRGPKPLFRI